MIQGIEIFFRIHWLIILGHNKVNLNSLISNFNKVKKSKRPLQNLRIQIRKLQIVGVNLTSMSNIIIICHKLTGGNAVGLVAGMEKVNEIRLVRQLFELLVGHLSVDQSGCLFNSLTTIISTFEKVSHKSAIIKSLTAQGIKPYFQLVGVLVSWFILSKRGYRKTCVFTSHQCTLGGEFADSGSSQDTHCVNWIIFQVS